MEKEAKDMNSLWKVTLKYLKRCIKSLIRELKKKPETPLFVYQICKYRKSDNTCIGEGWEADPLTHDW